MISLKAIDATVNVKQYPDSVIASLVKGVFIKERKDPPREFVTVLPQFGSVFLFRVLPADGNPAKKLDENDDCLSQ